jgi:voltage-gated potassium channel
MLTASRLGPRTMSTPTTRALKENLINAAFALMAIHAVGTIGFFVIGNGRASVFDAFYMTFITVATIGYAETVDLSGNVPGRLFNVAIAISGIGFVWVMFSNFTALLLARAMDPARQRARLIKEVRMMQGQFMCGLGRIGANVVRELRTTGHSFVAIEPSQAVIDDYLLQHRSGDERVLVADATDDTALLEAGLKGAAGLFAVTGDDSKNMLISLSAKQLNPAVRVVARVHDVRNVEKCRRAGADEIVSPDFAGALRMASAMLRPQAAGFIDELLSHPDAMRVVDLAVPAQRTSQPMGALELRGNGYLVLGVRHLGKLEVNPGPETLLAEGSVLIVLASALGKRDLEERLGCAV